MKEPRKFLISVGMVCIVMISASLTAGAICYAIGETRWIVVCVVVSVLAYWIGGTIAAVLNAAPEDETK